MAQMERDRQAGAASARALLPRLGVYTPPVARGTGEGLEQ